MSEELEGFVPVIIESLQARAHRADLPEPGPRAWDRAGDIVRTDYGLRIAWRLLKKAYARKSPELTEYMAEFVQMLRLSRLMSLGIVDPQSFAVGVIAGVAATGLFVGFAALLVVGIP